VTTLTSVLTEVAADVGAVVARRSGDEIDFLRGERLFACATGDDAEFSLDEEIAEAVLRTPDTAASLRGAGWVRLSVAAATDMDLDRARAWFLSAWRRAAE